MYLSLDTETTGVPLKGRPLDDPTQPRVIQLGGIRFNRGCTVDAHLSCLLRPDGWEVPEDMVEVHGITTGCCEEGGIDGKEAMAALGTLAEGCVITVAHHAWYDRTMIAIEAAALGVPDPLEGIESLCTMHLATDILRLPGWPGKYKYPSLEEACLGLLGRPPTGHHDAFFDAIDCIDLFAELLSRGAVDDLER